MYVKIGECSIQGAAIATVSARATVPAKMPRLKNSDVRPFLPTPCMRYPISQPSAHEHRPHQFVTDLPMIQGKGHVCRCAHA